MSGREYPRNLDTVDEFNIFPLWRRRSLTGYSFIMPVLLALLGLLQVAPAECGPSRTKFSITVDKAPPTVRICYFDPRHPPRELPRLRAGERGVTVARYSRVFNFDIDLVSEKREGGSTRVIVVPKSAAIKLSLPIAIWVPEHAPRKLLRHEDGHRRIHETVYKDAGALIRFYGERLQRARFAGRGADSRQAVVNAYRALGEDLSSIYERYVYDYSRAVSEEYDRLTGHGTNAMPEEEAIEKAFGKHASYRAEFDEVLDYYQRAARKR
ncbi:hypothetical protein GC174_06825 [bacterium]|nr:hypothetical protein [bacterium]